MRSHAPESPPNPFQAIPEPPPSRPRLIEERSPTAADRLAADFVYDTNALDAREIDQEIKRAKEHLADSTDEHGKEQLETLHHLLRAMGLTNERMPYLRAPGNEN